MQKFTAQQLGKLGEDLAAAHLQAKGYSLLARNYRYGHNEIDLILRHGNEYVMVEVKTLQAGTGLYPEASVTIRKQGEIKKAATAYVEVHNLSNCIVRFDVVAVTIGPGEPLLEHFVDAFR